MNRRRGFTLLELLLAMAMVAMLMLALYTGFVTAFRAQAIAGRQGDATRQAKIALDLLEQDLRSILPPKDGGLAGPFIGQASTDAIIDCYPLGADYGRTDSPTANGFRHVKFAVLADSEVTTGKTSNMLVRGVVRAVANTAETEPESEIIARNVSELTVRYYDGSAWADTWDSTQQSNGLPLAVELTISIIDPTPSDAQHVYKLTRTVRLSCGLTPDQATAVASAAADEALATETTSATGGTGTSGTSGTGGTGGTTTGGTSAGGRQ